MPERTLRLRFWGPVLAGVVDSLPCLMLVVLLAAGGHGSYLAAKLLFPITMLFAALTGSLSQSGIGFAVPQFPIYGAVLGFANENGKIAPRLRMLLFAHGLLVVSCLLLTSNSPF